LLKEEDVLLLQAEEAVRREEAARLAIRRVRRHHEERQPHRLLGDARVRRGQPPHLQYALGVVLEDGLAREQADVVAPLWRRRAQPRPLPSREQHCRHLSARNHLQAVLAHRRHLFRWQVVEVLHVREGLEALRGGLVCRVRQRRLQQLRKPV
jgi:hypothetical protein